MLGDVTVLGKIATACLTFASNTYADYRLIGTRQNSS
jgi:hypothetical protein